MPIKLNNQTRKIFYFEALRVFGLKGARVLRVMDGEVKEMSTESLVGMRDLLSNTSKCIFVCFMPCRFGGIFRVWICAGDGGEVCQK